MHPVFKIAAGTEWQASLAVGGYPGSSDDRRDGFIHLSAAHQVRGTLEKHFRDQRNLLLIAFDAEKLSPGLVWEPSRGGEHFPHYYGRLPTALALWARPIPVASNGEADVPPEWLAC